ncbi:hypothetical protein Y032_0611g642 [Ancylostoma ceylanicum]|uniref:Uncharacterized protein n=1 Tax=Ancylostoma ceylanicum TaxID=53326 RepID=A0A016WMI5_9BILA|nr:hypothetical protein Y032_0611g642 [Ancylostoma ceylanicum]
MGVATFAWDARCSWQLSRPIVLDRHPLRCHLTAAQCVRIHGTSSATPLFWLSPNARPPLSQIIVLLDDLDETDASSHSGKHR